LSFIFNRFRGRTSHSRLFAKRRYIILRRLQSWCTALAVCCFFEWPIGEDRVIVNADGRYLVHVPEFDQSLRLSARETMTRELARLLWERHGVSATYHSVLNGFDANGVPNYSDPPFDDLFHFNYGNLQQDF
jgi:hypothetical protein